MSVLRPLDKLPGLNTATILLVGTEDDLLQQLADAMLKEDCTSELKVHLAKSLPLPASVDRPRIDLIVFVVNLHSRHSLRNVEESLHHVDATFFLGKVSFLATGAGRESHCSIHRNTVVKLAHTYRSPLLFCDLEVRTPSTRVEGRSSQHTVGVAGVLLAGSLRTLVKGIQMWRRDPRVKPGSAARCPWLGHREPWVRTGKVGDAPCTP
eukprot:XP_007099947.2 centromere protein M isoform X1 [Physeter catodon]